MSVIKLYKKLLLFSLQSYILMIALKSVNFGPNRTMGPLYHSHSQGRGIGGGVGGIVSNANKMVICILTLYLFFVELKLQTNLYFHTFSTTFS